MPALIAIALAIYLIYALIRYVIIPLVTNVVMPILGFITALTIGIGALSAFYISIKSFIMAFNKHKNPYTHFVDKSKNASLGRRSYFFGPGYNQIIEIMSDTFSNVNKNLEALSVWRNENTRSEWYLSMWIWIFYIMAYLCTFIFGFAWVVVFSIITAIIIFIGMCIFYTLFSLLWIMDRTILIINSIYSRCGNCKKITVVPLFICPKCGEKHSKLTPGPYGIFFRRCKCKKFLSTTFFGRSKLSAACPVCETNLAVSGAHHYGVQLVGDTSAGKTTFLSAFWHLYFEQLKPSSKTIYEKHPDEDAFNKLEERYQQGESFDSTSEFNANMYSVVQKCGRKTPYQLAIYDIAGEAFINSNKQYQMQFEYCESIVFVLDPDTALSESACRSFGSFVREFRSQKGTAANKISNVPIAVIISKADKYKNIGVPTDIESCLIENDKCQEFLEKRGFRKVLSLLGDEFENVQFFFVSAKGHELSGKPYEPQGVNNVVAWIKLHSDKLMRRQKIIGSIRGMVALGVVSVFIALLGFFTVQVVVPQIQAGVHWVKQLSADVHWYTENPQAINFTISTAEELAKLSKIVNGTWKRKWKMDNFAGKTITLAGDIDLAQYKNWEPIGDSVNPFSGTFNGNGHIISNLTINRPDTDRQGLFGRIDGGKVQNLGLDNVNVKGRGRVGAVAGLVNIRGNITGSYSAGNISGVTSVGGITGAIISNSSVDKSYSTAMVNGDAAVGGVAGDLNKNSHITNSYFSGNVNGRHGIGGITGSIYDTSSVVNSFSTGIVNGSDEVGGIAGEINSYCYMANNYSIGTVSGKNRVGGIVGSVYNNSYITNSYSTSTVKGNDGVGGIAGGIYESKVTNSYSTSTVSGNDVVGGIAGGLRAGIVSNCAALNSQVKGYVNAGRVVSNAWNKFTISNNVAYSGMINNAGNTKWSNKSATILNGTNITEATIKRDGTIGGRFTAVNGWVVQNGNLPQIDISKQVTVRIPIQQMDTDPKYKDLNNLVGTWEGSYLFAQGKSNLTLKIYKEGGNYKAIYDFFWLPGKRNSKKGKYYMNVSYNQSTKKYSLKGYEWIENPGSYIFDNLEGVITGNIFSGKVLSNSNGTFKVVRKQ